MRPVAIEEIDQEKTKTAVLMMLLLFVRPEQCDKSPKVVQASIERDGSLNLSE